MKKIISAALAASVAASMSIPALAVLTADGEPVIQGDIMLLNEGVEVGETVEAGEVVAGGAPVVILPGQTKTEPTYTRQDITVTAVEDVTFGDVTYENGLVSYEDGSVRLAGTVIFDINGEEKTTADIKEGDNLIIFNNKFKSSDIPDYAVITDEDVYMNVAVDGFTVSETLGDYVDTQNFLAITVSEDTEIVDVEGNELTADDIADKYLMVFYDKMTMSIPAIANPAKVIVLGDYEPADEPVAEPTEEPVAEPEYAYEISVNWEDTINQDGVTLIPVRKYSESVGLEVAWNGEDKSVTIGTMPMGVSFKIGENSYSKSRMTPFTLEIAPQLINDTTYVPVSFFEQVLEAKVDIAE